MLMTYARDTKRLFAPYLDQTFAIVTNSMRYYLNDDVRMSAFTCVPYLFGVLKSCGVQNEELIAKWREMLTVLLERVNHEPEPFVLPHIFITIHECIEIMGVDGFDDDCLQKIIIEVEKQLREYDSIMKAWIGTLSFPYPPSKRMDMMTIE